MKTPNPGTKTTPSVAFKLMYNAASTKVSGWGGGSTSAGLFWEMTIRFMLVDAAVAALSLIRRQVYFTKFLMGSG